MPVIDSTFNDVGRDIIHNDHSLRNYDYSTHHITSIISSPNPTSPHDDFFSWLRSPETMGLIRAVRDRHNENLIRHWRGTCDWLQQNGAYTEWREGTKSPSILWLHSLPGIGKSILCSQAIRMVKESDPTAAVIYLFYEFDRDFNEAQTLQLLAGQLFQIRPNCRFADEVFSELPTERSANSLRSFITAAVRKLPGVCYFFFDGLDEECENKGDTKRWKNASRVLQFFIQLATRESKTVRLWYSSQFRQSIQDDLQAFTICNFTTRMKDDVKLYLTESVSSLGSKLFLPDEEQKVLQKAVEGRVGDSFLLASLVVANLEDASCPEEMMRLINTLPSELYGYYRKIFMRFGKTKRDLVW